ncbi:DUF1850 domain-containing protein [Indiicoccus explosivorum]|uniref:DUF1850 domain-containing protein n=1 Tax=Indiicoccus explosivorum TaxID=1917864 RepID=UPI000B44F991|nr:DUF1850 domain-containing protein [Indiicoccus explosivorum]
MRTVIIIAAAALLLAAAAALFIPWKESAVFISSETGKLAAYHPLEERTLKIRYTHSIHLSDVVETYEVTEDLDLRMTELEYEDFAIGMPANAGKGEVFVEKDGKYFIKNMDRVIPGFTLFIGDIDLELSLLAGRHVYNLKSVLERGESYLFRIEKLSWFDLVKGVELHE